MTMFQTPQQELEILQMRLAAAEAQVVSLTTQRDDAIEEARVLHALQAAGVDNWEGYSYAMDMLDEMD